MGKPWPTALLIEETYPMLLLEAPVGLVLNVLSC